MFISLILVMIIMIEIGIMSGWSSPYLAQLTRPDSPLPLTLDQASWVASLLNLGRFIGAIAGALFVNYLGSKRTLLLTVIPVGACWAFTIAANSFVWLYVARTLGGFGLGMTYSCFALYIGEVALPEIRGAVVSLAMSGGGSLGMVVSLIVKDYNCSDNYLSNLMLDLLNFQLSSICGSYLSMDISATAFLMPCFLLGMLFLWLPDSPHWLVKIEDYEGAKRAISWYQPCNDPDKELEIIKNLVNSSASEGFYQKLQKCKSEQVKRAIILIIVIFSFMQLTGLNSVLFYMEIILARSKLTFVKPSLVVICVSASGMLASAISVCLIDKCGRKFLLVISCVGVTMSMVGLAVNSYLIEMNVDTANLQLLPVFSVFLFIISYFVGLMCVPSTVLSEIFPSDIKCIAGCIASLVGALWSFAATKSFQPLVDSIGEPCVFLMHGIFALVFIPYVCFYMPETKGKSLQEIQDKLMKA